MKMTNSSLLSAFFLVFHFSVLYGQTTHNCTAGGVTRTYIKYVPTSAPATGAPLVFVLHGFTQTGQGIMGISNFNALADQHGFVVCYPNGIGNSWYIGATGAGTDDVAFLSHLIDTRSLYHQVNMQRVYTCGMSNGGYMSYKLACELPNRFAAIASVTGAMTTQMLNSCTPNKPVPVLEIHGTADGIVPYNGGNSNIPVTQTLDFWTANNMCASVATTQTELPNTAIEGSTVTRFLYDPCASYDYSSVEHLRINNGGHTWAGTSSLFSGIGNVNQDISASMKIWEFFNQFTLQTSTSASNSTTFDALSVDIFPNPVHGKILTIRSENDPITSVQLISSDGVLCIYQKVSLQTQYELPTQNLQNGLYCMKIGTSQGVITKKVVISTF